MSCSRCRQRTWPSTYLAIRAYAVKSNFMGGYAYHGKPECIQGGGNQGKERGDVHGVLINGLQPSIHRVLVPEAEDIPTRVCPPEDGVASVQAVLLAFCCGSCLRQAHVWALLNHLPLYDLSTHLFLFILLWVWQLSLWVCQVPKVFSCLALGTSVRGIFSSHIDSA